MTTRHFDVVPGARPGARPGGEPAARAVTGPGGQLVLPVDRVCGDRVRPVGVFVVDGDGVRFRPVVDQHRLAGYALAATAVVSAAVAVVGALRRGPAIGAVTMGPGGWVSLRNSVAPALRAERRPAVTRPRWARLLHADRLVVRR